MIKKILLLLVLALMLMSCSHKEQRSDNVTEVLFWHAMGGPLGEALISLVDEFNDSHPDIHIKAVNMGNYGALSTKLMASMQTDENPDIAQAFESWTANLVEGDKLCDLNRFIDADPEYKKDLMEDMFPVMLESNKVNGKFWSFAFNKSVRCLYYNKDMLFKHGYDPNKPPKTWDEFRDICKKLTFRDEKGNTEVFGTTFPVSAWQFENLLLQAGGEIMTPDYTTPLFASKEGVEALKFLEALLNEDKSAYLSTGYEGQSDFQAGKVAMVEGSSVSKSYMDLSEYDFFMGISAIPYYKTKKNIISGSNVVIFKNEDEKKEKAAWEFVRWFTDSKQTARWSKMTYYMPVRKSAFEQPALKERLESNPEIASVYDQLNYATFEPPISQWYATRKFLEEQVIEKVLRKKITPEKALKNAERELKNNLK